MPDKMPYKFFPCDCGVEGLLVQYDNELECFYITMLTPKQWEAKISWKRRLQWCWDILKSGVPTNCDDIIFRQDDLDRFLEFLKSFKRKEE